MIIADPAKSYRGKVCAKHPELDGLRRRSSATCVQCCRDRQAIWQEARRQAEGRARQVRYTPEEAAERRRQRDLERNRKRRKKPGYNAAQIERKRKWRAEHQEHHRATSRAYDAKQLRENLQRRLSKNLRHRIGKAMLGKTRGVSAVRDLGLTIDEFRRHIETQFTPGMSWDNYGAWHLDHIRPLISFDLTEIEQARAACHYTNYQPLWAIDNHRKFTKLPAEQPRKESPCPT